MPHLLIGGTTNSGKSVCVNSILTGFLLNMTPDQLRLLLVDPKRVELSIYNGIPHLLADVIVDAEKVVGALDWMLREMDLRYRIFEADGARNIDEFNYIKTKAGEKTLPYIVVVIDELADLMMLAPDETERSITRLAQLARATGIHLIIATQRPSANVITGLIKANFPARIAFAVASNVDSRVILDQPGAERLLGKGDMLFQAPDAAAPVRLQGTYVSDRELSALTDYWRGQNTQEGAPERPDKAIIPNRSHLPMTQTPLWKEMEKDPNADPIQDEALKIIRKEGRASVSMLQRKLRIGYTRSSRLIEKLEEDGIIGPPNPQTGTREVLDWGDFPPLNED
jgi:S-DNA-T family DNA segregation ATPase FtsK/SpoIIIE